MEIIRDDQAKMVQVWMTNQERQDTALQRQMQPMYAQWKRENFLVAVFQSGPRELQTSTRDLLSYNKKRIAQMEVARNKGYDSLNVYKSNHTKNVLDELK